MRINAINTVRYQNNCSKPELKCKRNGTSQTKTQVNPSFKSDAGALKGMLIGAGLGLAAAAAIVLTGGAAAVGIPAIGALGAGAGVGAQAGGIAGGLTSGDE